MRRSTITKQEIERQLSYLPEDGLFRWRVSKPRVPAGSVAGSRNSNGMWIISLDGARYQRSHLVWFMETLRWPDGKVGYRDGNVDNTRFSNLYIPSTHELIRDGVRKMPDGSYEALHEELGLLGRYRYKNEAYVAYDIANLVYKRLRPT